jgi:hypothetical protein
MTVIDIFRPKNMQNCQADALQEAPESALSGNTLVLMYSQGNPLHGNGIRLKHDCSGLRVIPAFHLVVRRKLR